MRLEPFLKAGQVIILNGCSGLPDLMAKLASIATQADPTIDANIATHLLSERERQQPTSTPEGVAFPHAMLAGPRQTTVVVALCKPGVRFATRGHPTADVIFCMIGSADRPFEHVRLLARLARIALAPGSLSRIRDSQSPQQLLERLIEEDRSHG